MLHAGRTRRKPAGCYNWRMVLIDTHVHLDAAEFDADRGEVVARARLAGVAAMVVPAVERANFAAVAACCARYPDCRPALGIHPMYVAGARPEDLGGIARRGFGTSPARNRGDRAGFLRRGFRPNGANVLLRRATENRPGTSSCRAPLHVRRAQDAILKQLRRIRVKGGIAHAFNGSSQQAGEFIRLGFKLGFGGAMTFPRATRLRRLAASLPLESVVLETDAPDIPPAFAAGGRNSPEYLPRIAQVLAELRGIGVEEAARATSANARAVLGALP